MNNTAHIRSEEDYQTVTEHLGKVGIYCGIYADKIGLKSFGELIGRLHDIGKRCSTFEKYIWNSFRTGEPGRKIDHSTAGAVYIVDYAQQYVTLNPSVRIAPFIGNIAAIVIMSHHGGLIDMFETSGSSPYIRRLNKEKEDSDWQIHYQEAISNPEFLKEEDQIKELFHEATGEMNLLWEKLSSVNRAYGMGMIVKFLFSCLVDADRYDTATYMDGEVMEMPRESLAIWETFSNLFENKLAHMNGDSEINRLRNMISATCFENAKRETGIYTLSCPTGSGKNFASLRFALNHAKIHKKERIFYIVPYISITDQNAEEIKKILSRWKQWKDDAMVTENILEVHSAKEVDMDTSKSEHMAERLDATIVLTTMVRFLNVFFEDGTKNIRALHNFANSIIIFDEVQGLPVKCIGMFNETLNFLKNFCGVTIILSTATQPALNHRFLNVSSLQVEENAEISGCDENIRNAFKRTEIQVFNEGELVELEEFASILLDSCKKENSILAVFNTKKSVIAMYQHFLEVYEEQMTELGIVCIPLTTNICAVHRKERINQIRRCLGDSDKKIIVLSTQLIEAGVDVSFSMVYRSFAGLDSAVQSAGRCNRHGESLNHKKVYLIKLKFDTVERLVDIQKAIESMDTILHRRKEKGETCDLDSEEMIQQYFQNYFSRQKEGMNYPIKNMGRGKTNMFDLLSQNQEIYTDGFHCLNQEEKKKAMLTFSYKTAAEHFQAIDSIGEPVIVQYLQGKELLMELQKVKENKERRRILRKLQQYTVNVPAYQIKELGNALTKDENNGIYILAESYYDENLGVVTTGKNEGILL